MASNAFKAATLAPLALAATACNTETESVTEKEDAIELSDLQVNLGGNLKVGSTLSAQALGQGISVNLSINDGEKQRRTLEALFNEFKNKKTVTITITNNGSPIYTITNDNVPTKRYTFDAETNNFTVSVEIADYKIALSKTFTVKPKEQGQGQEPGGSEEDPIEKPNEPEDPAPQTPEYISSVSFSTASESYQEESDTDLFTELRVAVTFDGDDFKSHTEEFNLEDLHGWLDGYFTSAGGYSRGYFKFELYADSDGAEEPLYSFSNGPFWNPPSILLNEEGAYPYRCTLLIREYYTWEEEEYEGGFSVNILPETGTPITIRSAALLWNLNADALPSPPQEVTLTATLIKALGDAASGRLSRYKTEERLVSNLEAAREHYGIDSSDNAAAASALAACIGGSVAVEKDGDCKQVEYLHENNYIGILEVPQYKILSTLDDNKEIKLDGDFYYTDMIIDASNLNINVDNAKFFMAENHKYKIYVEDLMYLYTKLQDKELNNDNILKGKIDSYKTPSLNFDIAYIDNIDMKDIASLYKIYEKESKLNNIQISYDMQKPVVLDGNENKEDAFLFKGNVLRSKLTSEEKSDLPNISVDVLLKLAELGSFNYRVLKNLVITGDYDTKNEPVDITAELTNVVFTGDVSGLKNSSEYQFNGVVYFMDKPYNNRKGDSIGVYINGLLKLDKLEGVTYDTFRANIGVLDVRGRDDLGHNPLKGYNIETESEKAINYSGHKAIYFTKEYVDEIENINQTSSIEDKFEELARRVHRVGDGGTPLRNVYVDNEKYDSIAERLAVGLFPEDHALSKTPRTLEEFEYYGNALDILFEGGKFKTPAYDSYNGDFTGVHPDVIEKLKKDKDSGAYQIP